MSHYFKFSFFLIIALILSFVLMMGLIINIHHSNNGKWHQGLPQPLVSKHVWVSKLHHQKVGQSRYNRIYSIMDNKTSFNPTTLFYNRKYQVINNYHLYQKTHQPSYRRIGFSRYEITSKRHSSKYYYMIKAQGSDQIKIWLINKNENVIQSLGTFNRISFHQLKILKKHL